MLLTNVSTRDKGLHLKSLLKSADDLTFDKAAGHKPAPQNKIPQRRLQTIQ